MTPPLNLAVLGAGYIGRAFASAAVRNGHHVWAVRRSAVAPLNDGVTWLRGDIAHGVIEGLPETLDAIVLTVAPSGRGDGYDETYPPAASAAMSLAVSHHANRVLYTSSTGVYGGREGTWVTEQSPRLGVSGSNEALIRAEDIVMGPRDVGATVFRVSGIYGPERDPRGRMQHASALAQRGEYWVNLAHRDDIVSAMLHTLGLDQAPAVLNISDGSPTRAADVARWLAARRGEDPATLIFSNADQRSRNDQRVSNAALVATGWLPAFPSFREGFSGGL